MKVLFLLLLLFALSLVDADRCPKKCECTAFKSLSCSNLTSSEMNELAQALHHPLWRGIEKLSFEKSQMVSFDILPQMDSLEDITLNNMEYESYSYTRKFRSVRKVTMEYNDFRALNRSVLSPFPSVEIASLRHNNIYDIGYDSLKFSRLREIYLNDNFISELKMHMFRFIPVLQKIDLSGNKIPRLSTSDFAPAGSLETLILSRNSIKYVESDTITPMLSLKTLDLSENNLSELPGPELRFMESLSFLNLSVNNISIIPSGKLRLSTLNILDLSHMKSLRVVEAGAFSALSHIHTVHLNDNPNLRFISPTAFENTTHVFSLNISRTSIKSISPTVLRDVAHIIMIDVPLNCGCFVEIMSSITSTTIRDIEHTTCTSKNGGKKLLSGLSAATLSPEDKCRPEIVLPFGEIVTAYAGQTTGVYCAAVDENDEVTWKTPHSEKIEIGLPPEVETGLERPDYFTSVLGLPDNPRPIRPRTQATSEVFRLDVVLKSDEGTYKCIVKRNGHSVTRHIQLVVKQPEVRLNATHISVSSVHLVWNRNLDIEAIDRVALQINTTNESEFRRVVQIATHNLYCSYNLVNLLPDKEYEICLQWFVTDDISNIYTSCIKIRTRKLASLSDSFGIEALIVTILIIMLMLSYCTGNCMYRTCCLYASSKKQSKLIQSVSGQSMISSSTCNDQTMYENLQMQMSSHENGDQSSMMREQCTGPLLSDAV